MDTALELVHAIGERVQFDLATGDYSPVDGEAFGRGGEALIEWGNEAAAEFQDLSKGVFSATFIPQDQTRGTGD